MEKKTKSDNAATQPAASDNADATEVTAGAASAKKDSGVGTIKAEPSDNSVAAATSGTDSSEATTPTASKSSKANKTTSKTPLVTTSSTKPDLTKPASSKSDPVTPEPTQAKPASPKAPEAKAVTAKSPLSKLAIFALVLALIALAVIGYGYTLIQKLQIQQSEQVSTLKSQLSDSNGINRQLQQQNGQILGELNQIRKTADAQQLNVNELQNRLAKSMQQVSKLGTDSRKDWLLAEVEYLLRLANQRVLMERTASGALSLLKGADKILLETEDVSIYPVRKALAQDIIALEAVPSLDIEGIFVKLAAINSQVDHLRLLPTTDKHQLPEMLQQITTDSMSESWQDGISQSWANTVDKLGKLIVIRHRDDPVTPLLSPEQHYFLTQNLHLMLEQAQLALLQGKQQVFDTALTNATAWIGSYFEATDPTTQALVQNLKALQGIEISPPLPNISGSLKQLNTYLAELHNLEGAAR